MQYKNHGQKSSFNGGIYYVDSVNKKLRTLLHNCKFSENKFHYSRKSVLQLKYDFPKCSNFSTKT